MPNWFKRTQEERLPPELEGKTPEQVVEALKETEALKTRLQALEGERATEREQVGTMTSEFNKLKERLAAADAARNTPPPNTEELANFVEDPDKAFAQRSAPIANVAIQGAAMTAKLLAQQQLDNQDMANDKKTMDGRLFRLWENEINEVTKRYQATQLTQPAAWLAIYFYVKGTHADELRDPEVRQKKYTFLEPTTQSVTPTNDNNKKPEDQLTDEEKRVAGKMGVSLENYAKRKKAMQFVNA